MGFDSVFKVRVSSGLQIKCFLPSQFVPGATTTGTFDSPGQILSSVMPDTCLAVEIDHRIGGVPYDLDKDGHRLKDVDPTVYFQTALLYTNSFGRRRLRVSTLALKTTTKMIQVYNSVNFDVIAAYMTRQAVNDYASHGEDGLLMNVRKRIADRCFGILANYTTCCDTRAQSKSQLLIPEKMKLLPLVCMGLKKSRMFRQSLPTSSSRTCRPSPSADERAYHIIYSSNISPSMAFLNLYPSLYDVTNLNENIGETVTLKPSSHLRSHGSAEDIKIQMASIVPYIQLPFTIRSSISTVNDSGIYLLDDGFTYSLFIGKDINVDVRTEILSIETYQDSQTKERSINISDSDYGIRIKAICSQLRKCYQSSLSPQCSRQVYSPINVILSQGGPGFRVTIDDNLESDFLKLLIEDTSETDVSYADFSMELYRRISDAVR
jgi:protein transport protein SEC24